MKRLIKLAIVDDNVFFRKSLANLIGSCKDFEIIIEASDGKELIHALEKQKPDVVLLDLEMPGMNGIKTTHYLSKHHPDIKNLILTMHNDEKLSHHLIEKGANGFLLKDADLNKLIDAIYTVSKHEYYFAGWDLQRIIAAKKIKKKRMLVKGTQFTGRELEVIDLICQQYTNKEISDRLFISMRTVDGHRDSILQKAQARNAVGLVMYAIRNGLITY
jgi:two-component system response regulator DegU